MHSIGYFCWLAAAATEAPLVLPPVGLMMFVGIVGCAVLWPSGARDHPRRAVPAGTAPLVLPVIILWCGVIFVHDDGLNIPAPRWPETLVYVLLLAHLPLGALLAWRLPGRRVFALSASVAVAGYSLGAAWVSLMSVTGRWL